VTTRLHGTGVGRSLAERVIAEAKNAWHARQVESSTANPRAAACLRKVGFVEWGRYPHQDSAPETFLVIDL
jgi:L-amino acid N-acyltransferase YncA